MASETGKCIISDLAIKTLDKALIYPKKKKVNLSLHSDQGSQLTSLSFIFSVRGMVSYKV